MFFRAIEIEHFVFLFVLYSLNDYTDNHGFTIEYEAVVSCSIQKNNLENY